MHLSILLVTANKRVGVYFQTKNISSWCGLLADFDVPNKIQPVCINPSGSGLDDRSYNFRCQRERQVQRSQGECQQVRERQCLER